MGTRLFVSVTCLAAVASVLVPPAWPAKFIVNSTKDAVDANPGDGICATATGECTLRAAIQETNALLGTTNEIFVPGAVYQITIAGAGEECAATGDLNITNNLILSGAGPQATIVDGGGLDRVFQILPSQPQCNIPGSPATPQVIISGMTVRNGNVVANSDSGGGIFNGIANIQGGFLTLKNVLVTGNAATFGGGIMNGWGASADIDGVTITSNTAAYGAGIYTRDTGQVKISNSTISGNTASTGGGGIDTWFNASLALQNVTIAQNTASIGAGINSEFNTKIVSPQRTIIAENNGANCAGTIVSRGYNLDSDSTCSFTLPSDLPGRNPLLGPLQYNGGPTPTQALGNGSPAINAGGVPANGCPPTDQRYYLRPGDGIACDIGAFENGAPATATVR
jgi:CSLREA domain-containing protein